MLNELTREGEKEGRKEGGRGIKVAEGNDVSSNVT